MNAVGAGAFILWYLVSRGGGSKPTKLKLDVPDSEPVILPKAVKPAEGGSMSSKQPVHPDIPQRPRPKNLNVMFNYNGHSWDAYEVLGVPAGANITMVTEAYHVALRRSDKESVEFLETAYKAILQKQ
ncbi:hypothetical protein D3C72_1908820 [compost metagenome]